MQTVEPPDTWSVAAGSRVLAAGEHHVGGRIRVYAAGCEVVLGDGVKIGPRGRIEVRGVGNRVEIGARVRLGSVRISVNGEGNAVVIGEGVTWESGGCMCGRRGQRVEIGDDSLISNDVTMRTSDAHGIYDRASGEKLNPDESVTVGAHVWIGNDVRVQKGAVIPTGTVIAQRAIVTGPLAEPNAVYAGIPAALKRSGIVWSRNTLENVPDRFR